MHARDPELTCCSEGVAHVVLVVGHILTSIRLGPAPVWEGGGRRPHAGSGTIRRVYTCGPRAATCGPRGALEAIHVAAPARGGMYEARERSQRAESDLRVERYRYILWVYASRRAIHAVRVHVVPELLHAVHGERWDRYTWPHTHGEGWTRRARGRSEQGAIYVSKNIGIFAGIRWSQGYTCCGGVAQR